VQTLERTRKDLMTKLDNSIETDNDYLIDKATDEIDAFSDSYPTYQITDKDIANSLKARAKRAAKTERGLYLDRKAEDFDYLIDRARRTLEEEERAARSQ